MGRSGGMDPIRLEPLSPAHVDGLRELTADPAAVRFTRIPEPVPPGFERDWVARYASGRREGTSDGFAVVGGDGAFLGVALVPELDAQARQAELGYLMVPAARGRGVASHALRLLTRWAFEEAGVLRAYLIIDVENAASEKVAARCGYVREGVMRSLHLKQEHRIDAALWSRLPTDPAPDA